MNLKEEANILDTEFISGKQYNSVNIERVMDQIKKKDIKLDLVHLGAEETAMVVCFIPCLEVFVHDYPEIGGNNFVHCNGPDCLLCNLGQALKQQLLLTVYLPKKNCFAILPFDPNCTSSHKFFTKIVETMEFDRNRMIFVSRYEYEDGDGENVVEYKWVIMVDEENYSDYYEAYGFYQKMFPGFTDILDIYPRISNEKFASIKRIKRLIALKKEGQFSC